MLRCAATERELLELRRARAAERNGQDSLGRESVIRDLRTGNESDGSSAALAGSRVELRQLAFTPSNCSAFTWSCISAMSGEITTPIPSRSNAGIW